MRGDSLRRKGEKGGVGNGLEYSFRLGEEGS